MATQTIPVINQTIAIDNARIAEFQAASPTLVKQAQDFTIEDDNDYESILVIGEEAIRRQKIIKDFFSPTKRLADQLHGSLCDMERNLLTPYVQVERLVKGRRQDWRDTKERIRLQKEADDRKKAKEEADARALAEAAQLEKEGEKEAAEVVMERALSAPAPAIVVPSSVPKQANSSIRGEWDFRIDDANQVQREYCSPDEKSIRAIVKALGKTAPIRGITVFWKEIEAIRTKGR